MSANPRAYIAGIGMITPVGFNAEMTVASIKAGISRYGDSGYHTPRMEPIKMALVPTEALASLEEDLHFYGAWSGWDQRLLRIALPALTDAFEGYQGEPLPLVLACPEHYPQQPHRLPDDFLRCLVQQSGLPVSLAQSRTVHTGRAGVLDALQLAMRLLFEAGAPGVVVGGVDSYQRPELLHLLAEEDRLLVAGNTDGFVPGEGAGFLRLTRHQAEALTDGRRALCLHAPGVSEEPGHIYSDEPYLGEGLNAAVAQALAGYPGPKIQYIYSSMNGERFWAKETGVALARHQAHLAAGHRIEHPADCYGDLGAATGAVLTGLAALDLFEREETAAHLVLSASDHAWRAAAVVGAADICSGNARPANT